MKVRIRRITYEEANLSKYELMTQAEAAKRLGITVAGVRSAMDSGHLPTVFVPGKRWRVTLRSAVEEMAREKAETNRN